MDGQNFDPSFGKLPDPFKIQVEAPELQIAQPKFVAPKLKPTDFYDDEILRSTEQGATQFASGVVRVSDASAYDSPPSNESIYGDTLGITRATELRAAVGLTSEESFTEYYRKNQFVPKGFELDAKLLIREEKIKKMEKDVSEGRIGYNTFLFRAYGEDLLKADGHDLRSSLYWYNRRKQGMLDSPIDNITYLQNILQQAEAMYQREVWYSERNTRSVRDSFLSAFEDKNKLPDQTIAELFKDQFSVLDDIIESETEILRLYRAGLLKDFNPTIDEDGDGKIDWYLHRDGMLYKVYDAGQGTERGAIAYYNKDGSLNRIETPALTGVYLDQFIQGFGSSIAGIADLFIYGAAGIVDLVEMVGGDFEFDKLGEAYKNVEGYKAGTYLFGNNVYQPNGGWTNSDGSINTEGILFGAARATGYLAGMIATMKIGGGLANAGVSVIKTSSGVSKQVVKTGIGYAAARHIGSAINGVVGLGQGVYSGARGTILSATQATTRGLLALAIKDFTMTVGALEANKAQLGIETGEIFLKSAGMAAMNFGISFFLRSVGDTPALTRLATWQKAKMGTAANIRSGNLLTNSFSTKILEWSKDAGRRNSFIITNSVMDMMENFLTMGTQTSLATTGELFDAQAWAGLLDPQNLLLQSYLLTKNLAGGIRGTDEQMGVAGIAAKMGNLEYVYEDTVKKYLEQASKLSAEGKTAAADTIIKEVEAARNLRNSRQDKNIIKGTQDALMYLHDTFKTNDDVSLVRKTLVKKYKENAMEEIQLATQAAFDQFANLVKAKNQMVSSTFLTGDLFDPKSEFYGALKSEKLDTIKKVTNSFVEGLKRIRTFDGVTGKEITDLLLTNNKLSVFKNREQVTASLVEAGADPVSLSDIFVKKVTKNKKTGVEKVTYEIKNDFLDKVDEKTRKPIVEGLTKYVNEKLSGNIEMLAEYYIIVPKNPGSQDSEAQKRYVRTLEILKTMADVIGEEAGESGGVRIFERIGELDAYLIPGMHLGLTQQANKTLNAMAINLFTLKYANNSDDKTAALRFLVENLTGLDFDKALKNTAEAKNVLRMLNKLAANGFLTTLQLADVLSSSRLTAVIQDNKIKISGVKLEKISEALTYSDAIEKIKTLREDIKNIPKSGEVSPELYKRFQSFINYFDTKLSAEIQEKLFKQGLINKAELEVARNANPRSDAARLKRLFESSRTGLGLDPNNKEDLELIKIIEEEFINSEGFKEKYSEEASRILKDTFERRIGNEKNLFKKKVLSGILEKVASNEDLDLTDQALLKQIIDQESAADPKLFNEFGVSQTDIEDLLYEIKSEVFRQVFFEAQTNDVLFNKFVYDIYYKNKKGKVAYTFDEFHKNKSKKFKDLNPRSEVLKVALKEKDLTKLFIENARDSDRFELASKLFSDWFTKDTVDANSSMKIVVNVNELVGSLWQQIKNKSASPSVKFDIGEDINDVGKVLKILFGSDYADAAKVELTKQLTQKENLPLIYRDTIENTGGFLVFDFYVEDGRIVIKDLDQKNLLLDILNKLGYEVYNLEDGLQDIPGIYFNVESSSKAMSLEFNSIEEKNKFLRSMRSKAVELVENKIQKEIKTNLDYRERLIQRTGGVPFIDEETVFDFEDIDYIPSFVGQEGTVDNPFRIEYVNSVFDAFRKGEIKQGKLGGLLIKAYAMSRLLPGATSAVDVNLRNNYFLLDVIRAVDGFSKKLRAAEAEETFNETIMYFTDQEVKDFKNNGNLFDIIKVQPKIKGEEYAQYLVRPKADFENLALEYLRKNPNNVQLKYILPLAFYDKPSSYEVAMKEYLENKNLKDSGNVIMANTRRLERNTSGADMIIDVANNLNRIYSEQFIQSMYEGPLSITYKTELNGKVAGEQEVINAVKGKTYKEIIELNNNPDFKNNIYYVMLYRQLTGAKFYSDQILFGDSGFGFDSANKNLAVLLADDTVKTFLADGLEEIQKLSDPKEIEKAKAKLVKKINKFIREQDKQSRIKVYTLQKDLGKLEDFEKQERDQIDSYKIKSMGLRNKLTGEISVEDITDIIDTFENDYEFYRTSSFKANNELQNPIISKLLSVLETSSSVDNKLNIFVEDLFRFSPEEFKEAMKILRDSGMIAKKSLDDLEAKFASIEKNSTYYRETFNQSFRKNYTYEEGLIKLHNVPSTARRNDVVVVKSNDPTSRENFRKAFSDFVQKPKADPLADKSQIKVSQSDLGNFRSANIMRLFKNMIEEDLFSTFGASRLMNNLSHARFLGEYIYNIVGSAKALKSFMGERDPSLTNQDYIKIAMSLYKQSSGVAYDRSFPAFFLYDKQTKKVIGIDGTANNNQALDKIGLVYFRDIENETSDRYWMFNVDKNAFSASGSSLKEGFKALELTKENKEKVKAIVSNYILKEVGALKALENESAQDKIVRVLTRNPTMRDKFDYIKTTLNSNPKVKALFDKMGERATNRLIKGLFLTGENVRVGSPNLSLALTRAITSVRWEDESYRSDIRKQNNLIRNLNNFVYLIDPENVSYNFNVGKKRAEKRYNDSLNQRFDVAQNRREDQTSSDYRSRIKDIFRTMNEENIMSVKSKNKIEALYKAYSNIFTEDQITQDVFAYYVYNKDNGATLNFLMLNNDIQNIVTKSLTTDDTKVLNGRYDFRSLVNQELFFGDVETLGEMVYEVSFIKSKAITDSKDAINNPNKYFADEGKKILIPMFYNGRFLNRAYLNELVPENISLEEKIKKIMPDFYEKFIKDNRDVTMKNLDNYFKTIDSVVKNIPDFESKGLASVENYLIREARAYGYTNIGKDLPLLVSFNGASFDFGRGDVEGILYRSGVVSSKDNIFNQNHLDVLQDIIKEKRFITENVFEDQQKNSLSFLAKKFGVDVTGAHDSIEDVKTLAKVLFVLQNDFRNTNKITSNLLVTMQDIYRVGTGREINEESILKVGNGLEKISDEDIADERTISERNLYREIFSIENLSELNDLLGKSMSVVKDYLDTIEREVFRKKVREMVTDELGSKIKVFENIQKNTSKFLPGMIEYFLRKKYPNVKFNSADINSFARKGAETETAGGYLLGDIFKLFQNAFGTRYEETASLSLSQRAYDQIFSIESEEELFTKLSVAAGISGIEDVSYEDYLKSKGTNDGSLVRGFAENFLSSEIVLDDGSIRNGSEYIGLVNENERLRRAAGSFQSATEEIFADVFKGLPEEVVLNILDKSAKVYLKNAKLDEVAYQQRIRMRGLMRDNKFLTQVKNILSKYSFGANFRRSEFYDRVTAIDRSREYFVYDNEGNVVKERLNAFDIGMTEETYKELTGVSYQDSLRIYYPQDFEKDSKAKKYRSVPLNIIRYPQDGVGRQAVLNVRILAPVPGESQYSNKPLINLDVLKAFLSGDVDGDSISILQPTKGSIAFNNNIRESYNLTFDIFEEAYDIFLGFERFGQQKLSDKNRALQDFDLQRNFASRVLQDLNKLNKKNVNFENLKQQRKAELTEILIKNNYNLIEKDIDDVLENIWIKQFDITEFIKSETESPFVYHSLNIYSSEIEENKNAYLAINAAKIYNFDKQAALDVYSGYKQKLANKMSEKISSEDPRSLFNYAAFDISEGTYGIINRDVTLFRSDLVSSLSKEKRKKQLTNIIGLNNYKIVLRLVAEAETAPQVIYAMQFLNKMIMESEKTKDSFVLGFNEYQLLDKEILDSLKNENEKVLEAFATLTGAFNSEAKIKPEDLTMLTFTSKMERLFDIIANNNLGNYWASSNNSFKRNEAFKLELQKNINTENKSALDYKKMHEQIYDIVDQDDESGFKSDMHVNALILINPGVFGENIELDTHKVVKGDGKYGGSSINLWKFYSETIDEDDARTLLGLQSINKKVLTSDVKLGNGKTIPSGAKIEMVIKNPNGTISVAFSFRRGYDADLKFTVPGTKNFKTTLGGNVNDSLETSIRESNIEADFVFGEESFKTKNATPFFNRLLKNRVENGLFVYYKVVNQNGKRIFVETDSAKDADAYMIKQLPAMVSQESFFRKDLKEKYTDDIAISTGRRNLTSSIITKDYLFEIDGNEIKFSDKIIEDGYKAFETFNQPTLLENNAALLHSYMLNAILIKYLDIDEKEKQRLYASLNNYTSSELMDLFGELSRKYVKGNNQQFFENNLTPMEKIIFSEELYQGFLDNGNPRILTSVKDLDFVSKKESFARKNRGENSKLRNFKVGGALARELNTSNYQDKYVISEAFGNMGMVEYMQFLIESFNKQYNADVYRLSRKDLQNLSIAKILNLGTGIGGSIYDKFGTLDLDDSRIIEDPEMIGSANTSQKTSLYFVAPKMNIESGVLKRSILSDTGRPREVQNDYTQGEYLLYKTFDPETGKFTRKEKTFGPELNVDFGNGNKRLFRSEARFLANILGVLAPAKDAYERASLFGYNPNIYLPFSLTNIGVNPNDKRIQLAYTPDFVETNLKDVNQALRNKINSDRFLDVLLSKGKDLKDSIKKSLTARTFSESNGKAIEAKQKEEMDSVLNRGAIFGDDIENEKLDDLLRNLRGEEDFEESYEQKFRRRIEYEEDMEALTTMFKSDLLASGGIKVGTNLDLEVERMVKDFVTNQKFFMRKFSRPLENLADLATRYGAYDLLQKYAALKYYDHMIPKLEADLTKENIKDSDKTELTMLLKNYKEERQAALDRYNTSEEFLSFFERAYSPLVTAFNQTNKILGEQFRAYSIVTDQASDLTLYMLKPKVKKGFEKAEQALSKINMFTYNDESLFKSKDLGTPNYFINMFDKIGLLTKQATVYTMSEKMKSLGLMANKTVIEYVENSLLDVLEMEAKKIKLSKGENSADLLENQQNYFDDVIRFLPLEDKGEYILLKKSFGTSQNFGENLFGLYKKINETLNKHNAPSRAELEKTLRTADKGSKEWEAAYNMMKLYEYKDQTLIMLTNMIDSRSDTGKSVLNSVYEGMKVLAEKNNVELTDRFGRKITEDPTQYKALFPGSTNEIKHLVKFSYFGGGFEKNVVLDALNGDVFFGNKSLVDFLDKEVFTTKMPNSIVKSIAKLNGITSKLIMSNPFRFIDRLIGFTLYDIATLSSSEPATLLKVGRSMNEVSAMLQSGYSVISPELQEFLIESGMSVDKTKLTEIFADFNPEKNTSKLLNNPYFDVFEKGFSAQNIVGRYAYWLAVKEKFDNKKAVNYGPSYYVKNAIDGLTDKVDKEGEVVVSASGRKAMYMLSNILGSPGDFPIMAKKLKGLAMFTTFPLAAGRFARNMLASGYVAMKDLMMPGNKSDSFRWLTSTALGTAGLFAIPWLIFEIWGGLLGLEDEEEEQWKEDAGMPELFRTVFSGSPVINKFNTFNQYALLDSMTIKPFRDAMEEGGTFLDGLGRFFLDNIASRAPAPAKLTAEVLGGVDTFGGTIRDNTDQWSMWENFQRKALGYIIGGSGANALTTYLNKDAKYENTSFVDLFANGFSKVVEAEMGNTVSYKADVRNYYKANSIIQSERFANRDFDSYSDSSFNLEKYNSLKSELGRALRRKAKPSVIYGILVEALQEGVGIPEVRSALRNNSLEYKLSTIENLDGFISGLNESDYKTISDAIAWERQQYPFLDEFVTQINDMYNKNYAYQNSPRKIYIPRVYSNNTRYPARIDRNGYLRNTRFNPYFRIQDPFKAYRSAWYNIMNFDQEE